MFSRWKIPLAIVLCVLCTCALTYPMWRLGQHAIEQWGIEALSRYGVQKYFNRCFLLCGLVTMLCLRQSFRFSASGPVSTDVDFVSFWRGVLMGGATFLVLFGLGLAAKVFSVEGGKALGGVMLKAFGAASVVAVIEEWLFRRQMLNAALVKFGPTVGQVIVAAVFASVHFLKPTAPPPDMPIDALVGFRLLPLIFHKYGQFFSVIGGWSTLFVLGLALSRLSIKSGGIAAAIGVHGALIVLNKTLASQVKVAMVPPWFGGDFQTGLMPFLALAGLAWIGPRWVCKKPDSAGDSLRG